MSMIPFMNSTKYQLKISEKLFSFTSHTYHTLHTIICAKVMFSCTSILLKRYSSTSSPSFGRKRKEEKKRKEKEKMKCAKHAKKKVCKKNM